jgi:hypothetical protein
MAVVGHADGVGLVAPRDRDQHPKISSRASRQSFEVSANTVGIVK